MIKNPLDWIIKIELDQVVCAHLVDNADLNPN